MEKLSFIASFYERHRRNGAVEIKQLLSERNITRSSAESTRDKILECLIKIEDEESEELYSEKVKSGEVPDIDTDERKLYFTEKIINQQIINNTATLTCDDVSAKPEFFKNTFKSLVITGYKFQLKYTLVILDIMLDDTDIWEKIQYH